MIDDTDLALKDLEDYLVSLDELGKGELTSGWVIESPEKKLAASKKDTQDALRKLFEEAINLSSNVEAK